MRKRVYFKDRTNDPLTERQKKIIEFLKVGESTVNMAKKLNISTYTARNDLRFLFFKYKVNSRNALIIAMHNEQILKKRKDEVEKN